MLIRSQDRMNLFDMVGCNVMIRNDHAIIGFGNNQPSDEVTYLGAYHSEQRAIEVLDEICNAYIGLNGFKANAPHVKNGIYQMPEE